MRPVLSGIANLDRALRDGARHPLLGTGSIHASLISGGTELSKYPDECRLAVERRTVPGEGAEQASGELNALIADAVAADASFVGSLTRGLVRDPYEIAIDEPIVQVVRASAAEVLGRIPVISGESGWMDSAILGAAGIPTVIFGPDGHGAHSDEEWVDLESLERCRQIYLTAARRFCA